MNFFSNNRYVFLPTKRSPKVALVIDNPMLVKNALKLYNPFSKKAKILKFLYQVLLSCNNVFNRILNSEQLKKSTFINFLEHKLGTELVSSIYFSTSGDMVVIQLQTPDAELLGYMKYPLNGLGVKHLNNEKTAIDILSNKSIVVKYLIDGFFDNKPFILLPALEGDISIVEQSVLNSLLIKLKRNNSFILREHPRVLNLKKQLEAKRMNCYVHLINSICSDGGECFSLVYEHGDFTPWNIIKEKDQYTLFDFEYFVKDGLEFFDLIMYYYQIGRLLKKKSETELISYIFESLNIKGIKNLLQLFLLKEIVKKVEIKESYKFEIRTLEILK